MIQAIRLCAPLLVTACLVLAGCGNRSEAELLAAARAYLDKRDPVAASIELKNLLQSNPDSGEARFLLGKLQFERGDAAGAEAHLQRAISAGYSDKDTYPLMASVLLAQQKQNILLQQYSQVELTDNLAAAEFQTLLATAHLINNSVSRAEPLVASALRLAPTYPPAILLQASLQALKGDNRGAISRVEELLVDMPGNGRAWALKGDLLLEGTPSDTAPVLAAYRKATELEPTLLSAHSKILELLVGQRDFDAAARQLEQLRKAFPKHPETLYFDGVLALQKGDAKRTRDITADLLRSKQPDPRVLVLAGQAEMALNAMPQAEALFGKAAQLVPNSQRPRRMLAQLYLRSGQETKALGLLKPLVAANPQDVGLLLMLGRAQLMSGDAQGAEVTLAKAAKLQPEDKRIRASAAVARLGKGQDGAAIADLETVAASDTGTMADLALISERLRRKDFDAALKAVNVLAGKLPQAALPDVLRGRIAMQRRDGATARKSFEAALSKEPGNVQALDLLVALDVGEGKLESARMRLESELQRNPGNVQGHLALASISRNNGATREEVTRLIERAVTASPTAADARIALIDHHMVAGDAPKALAAAQAAVAALPDNPALLDRLGRVQVASGDVNQALPTFNKLAGLQPGSALPHLRIAEAHLTRNDTAAAATSVRRAMEAEPQSLAAQRMAIALAMRDKRTDQALEVARTVQKQRPADPVGHLLEGEIETARKDHGAAATAFRKAVALPGGGSIAPLLHRALLAGGNAAEADRMAQAWLKAHPADSGFLLHLGELAQAQSKPAEGELRYREVLRRSPNNLIALNNLAHLLAEQNKPGAIALAEQAVSLAPDQAVLLDTLAFSYAQENQMTKALTLQARAVALAPGQGDFRLNLAKLQLQSGDKTAARAELDKLGAQGKAYPRHEEVTRLRSGLGG